MAGLWRPATQVVQADAFGFDLVPASHTLHFVMATTSDRRVLHVPAGHAVQLLRPVALNHPAGQSAQ